MKKQKKIKLVGLPICPWLKMSSMIRAQSIKFGVRFAPVWKGEKVFDSKVRHFAWTFLPPKMQVLNAWNWCKFLILQQGLSACKKWISVHYTHD